MRLGWLTLVVATLAAALVCSLMLRDALQAGWSPSAYAASRGPDPAGRTYRNGNTNDNADGDNGQDADNDEGGDNGQDGDNDEGGDNADRDDQDNDNQDDFGIGPGIDLGLPPPASSIRQPEPSCSAPGQDTVFTSFDRKVTVRIPGSSPRSVRVLIYLVINAYEAPPPPGAFVHPLVYEIKASYCDADTPAAFPAGAALAIRYTDLEATALDEGRFVIGRLDMATGAWVPVEQRANDPTANVVAATVTETGFYMVWEAR
jgi:hypothetical protein